MEIANKRTNGKIQLRTGGVGGMTIADDGNVGIGTEVPLAKFEVDGDIFSTSGGYRFPDGTTQTTSATDEVYFSVKRDASYDWPSNGTAEIVDFSSNSTIWSNVGGGFDQSSSTFSAPVSGTCTFHGAVNFRSIAAGDLIYAEMRVAGKYYRGSFVRASGIIQTVQVDVTVHLNAGELAFLQAHVSAASAPASAYGNGNTTFAFTHFSGALVR
jgi:hypothetical protein